MLLKKQKRQLVEFELTPKLPKVATWVVWKSRWQITLLARAEHKIWQMKRIYRQFCIEGDSNSSYFSNVGYFGIFATTGWDTASTCSPGAGENGQKLFYEDRLRWTKSVSVPFKAPEAVVFFPAYLKKVLFQLLYFIYTIRAFHAWGRKSARIILTHKPRALSTKDHEKACSHNRGSEPLT